MNVENAKELEKLKLKIKIMQAAIKFLEGMKARYMKTFEQCFIHGDFITIKGWREKDLNTIQYMINELKGDSTKFIKLDHNNKQFYEYLLMRLNNIKYYESTRFFKSTHKRRLQRAKEFSKAWQRLYFNAKYILGYYEQK